MKRLLTIQDISCVGQCSTTVALPLVSACGVECAVLPPAILSNHTGGFKSWTFADLTGELPKVEAKWIEHGIRFDAFYTGYVCESHIDPILSIFRTC
ncbi:MAG: phosphomethylpyrimidine kinase, partial [Kiritimatiellae bacterium]|nr:phosphomethylpyrimidine kinase [Kiritimatiellia bacterium]